MAAIPFIYNIESVRARWTSSVVAVAGIAGTVAVFVAMMALANGFRATLVKSGSEHNAVVRRAGATSEMDSILAMEDVRVVEDAPEVAKQDGPMVSPEIVVITSVPLASDQSVDANVQVRGIGRQALAVHDGVRVVEGRFIRLGLAELVVGKNARLNYAGLALGDKVKFGGREWDVVGVLDAGGSSFDSEIWADADILADAYQRPRGTFQSVTARLTSPEALAPLRDRLMADPRVRVQVESEVEYYSKASGQVTRLITSLGSLVVLIMGLGAIFGALNTMYSAVAERTREIATLRAIGFGGGAVVVSFVFESVIISLIGGVAGCLLVLPVNGLTTGTMNWQTFSHLAFAFQVTPGLMAMGLAFALVMGLLGGVPPAVRAARLPVAAALRDL
jgi:putative ABC transport system permease protein